MCLVARMHTAADQPGANYQSSLQTARRFYARSRLRVLQVRCLLRARARPRCICCASATVVASACACSGTVRRVWANLRFPLFRSKNVSAVVEVKELNADVWLVPVDRCTAFVERMLL